MSFVSHIVTFVSGALDRFAAWVVLPILSLVVLADVFMRYALNAPIIWSLETTEYLLLLVFLFALPECSRRNGHVHVDMFLRAMPEWLKRPAAMITPLLFLWIVYLLAGHAWHEFLFNLERGRGTQYLHLPLWVEYFALLIVGALLAVINLLKIVAIIANRPEIPGPANRATGG